MHNDLVRILFPSRKAIQYLKRDLECSQYLDKLINETIGEIIINDVNGDLVGYVFVYNTGKNDGFMFNLIVQEKYRGMGLGTILATDAVNKFNAVDLTVKKSNKPAIAIYKKLGFKVVDIVNSNSEYYMKRNW